jgi:hypothetical protein
MGEVIGPMPDPSPFSTRFDHRVPRGLQPLWRGLKWGLGGLGAYLLVGHYVLTWGWPATLWFLAAPFAWGIWLGLKARRPASPTLPPERL